MNHYVERAKQNVLTRLDEENLMTAPSMEQENPRPDQAVVGVLVSPAGCKRKSEQDLMISA